jgi:hypothetical protein
MHPLTRLLALALWAGVAPAGGAQQEADTLYRPDFGAPRFPEGSGPLVFIDGGHATSTPPTGAFCRSRG